MNFRSLTRGDAVVIGAAVLLFIASFLSLNGGDSAYSTNAWDLLGLGLGTYISGVVGGALIVVNRALPQPRKVAGLDLGQAGVAISVVTFWTLLWWMIDDSTSNGAGLIVGFIAALVLAAGAVASPLVPALQAPLMGAPRPQQQMYGGQQPQGGYGYPGAQQGQQPYGAQQGQQQPYGAQQTQGGQPVPGQQQSQQPQQTQGGAPAGDFSPFWFAVPVQRPLYGEDGSPTPIAELAPGTWYLAVEQRGPGLVAQTQDGRRGVLQDTTGIQRG
ncbi:hypothetical protein [Streptomyces sp. NPDC002851]